MNLAWSRVPQVRVACWCLFWLAVCCGAFEAWFRAGYPWRIRGLEPHMLLSRADTYAHNAFQIQRVIRNRAAGEPVVLLGGSTGLLSLKDDRRFGARLGKRLGRPIRFTTICATYQVFTDDAMIADELGSFGGTLLLALEAPRFAKSAEQQMVYTDRHGNPVRKYFYLSPGSELAAILERHGRAVSLNERLRVFRGALNLGGRLMKRFRELVDTGKYRKYRFKRLYIAREIPAGKGEIARIHEWLADLVDPLRRWQAMNFEILEHLVRSAQARGNRVILLDMPYNPTFADDYARLENDYDDRLAELVRRRDLGYVDLRNAASWEHRDFRDAHHLRAPGRRKFASALQKALAEEMAGR